MVRTLECRALSPTLRHATIIQDAAWKFWLADHLGLCKKKSCQGLPMFASKSLFAKSAFVAAGAEAAALPVPVVQPSRVA
jgi:hypothetical protein